MANNRVLVVGGGLAGLSATMKLAELGVAVDLLSLTPVKRSHSVCACLLYTSPSPRDS